MAGVAPSPQAAGVPAEPALTVELPQALPETSQADDDPVLPVPQAEELLRSLEAVVSFPSGLCLTVDHV